MEIPVIVGLLSALAVLAVFVGLGRAIEPPTHNRLENYLSDDLPAANSTGAYRASRSGNVGDLVQGVDKIVRSASAGESLARSLRQADLQVTVTEFLALWVFALAAG